MAQDRDKARGITLMIVAMALFALADTSIKLTTGRMSPPQIVVVMGLGGTICFSTLALLRGMALFPKDAAHPAVLARNAAEVVGACAMIAALATTPLTIVGAILQATPLAVMAGAALLLGEMVGWRRWTAASVGFAGVLIVLDPWQSGLTSGALLALLAMLALSARDLLNRRAPASLPTLVLAAHGVGTITLAGLAWLAFSRTDLLPVDPPWPLIGAMVLCGTAAYFSITASVRVAPISVVAPFRYSRMLFLAALGMVFFGEALTWELLLGATLVIGSGLYVLARERRTSNF